MTSYLDDLMGGEILPGRYRLTAPAPVRALRDEVTRAGWTTRLVDGALMHDRDSMFDEFAAGLEFPEYFGHNWDALADCLRDLSWLPGNGTVLLWWRSAVFEAADPEVWHGAGIVIDAAIESRIVGGLSPLSVLYPAADGATSGGRSTLEPMR